MLKINLTATSVTENLITGHISFDNGDALFPEKGYRDCLWPIVGWWCNEFSLARDRRERRRSFLFMDSECQIVLYRKKNKVRLRGYDGQLLLWEVQSTLPEIREALLSAVADLEYQYKGLRDDILEPYLAYFINAKRKLK